MGAKMGCVVEVEEKGEMVGGCFADLRPLRTRW